MRYPCIALLALLLRAWATTAASTATATAAPAADHSPVTNCTLLAEKSADRAAAFGRRHVSVNGRAVNVTLVWGSEPAHAAAALLSVLLRHVRLYLGVLLSPTAHPHATAALAANVTYYPHGQYSEFDGSNNNENRHGDSSTSSSLVHVLIISNTDCDKNNISTNAISEFDFQETSDLYRDRNCYEVQSYSENVSFNSVFGPFTLSIEQYLDRMDSYCLSLIIGVSTAWEPEAAPAWYARNGSTSAGGLAGPRLSEFGASSVPARRRLFAWLTPIAREQRACRQHARWAFYANPTALADCDFIHASNPQGNLSTVDVLGVGDCNTTLQRLQARATATKTPFHVRQINRSEFMRTLHTANRSLLFLDYDMWQGAPGVRVVEPPPCISADFDCKLELDSAIAMRVADVKILQGYAPQFFQFVHDFKPSLESLRMILKQPDIEEAACEWVLGNERYVVREEDKLTYDMSSYEVVICCCEGDPDNDFFKELKSIIVEDEIKNHTVPAGWSLTVNRYTLTCSDQYSLSNALNRLMSAALKFRLIGIVSLSVEGAVEASPLANAGHVPLMLADVVPEDGTDAAGATWRVAGRPRHIARALRHFVRVSGWMRVAVLSQDTRLADDYYDALKHKAEIILRNFPIPTHLSDQQAQEVLQDLQATNARILFVNADTQTAHTILTAAVAGGMGYTDGFVWIVREWRQNSASCGTEHFTVSLWARGVEDLPVADGRAQLHEKLSKQWPGRPWPPRAVSLIDALLSLSIGFNDVYRHHPNVRQDLHTASAIRSLQESLIETPVTGASQRLHYKERSLEETFVFVDQWCGSEYKQRLATWRVNATSGVVRGKSQEYANYSRPTDLPYDDGASGCIVRSGDEFDPTCHDAECVCSLMLLVLAPGAVLLARRTLRRHLARLQQEQQIQAISRRRHVANVLAAYLVERAALELHEELGAGRFGSVRLARLRKPGRGPRYIAAKALRDNAAPAEESEFLREACTIASLNHTHIVRLVGVCIADGPPLVLMELAFFGDLLGYLRARRHLVEGLGSEATPAESSEEEHVSAEALTRLAREAAEALQYLCVRGVVHRDVRAANCLVDVRRSLKLADFGMARDTVAGADGAPEYSCRRRGLFPVLWMAPESLAHGVFSAASDVWALGVLVLELVTLGVRPYGSMSPLRVLEYVAAGGSPPLPLDASPQTRGLARLCWARAAERRPSAAEVAAYLAAWPLALHPALLTEYVGPADADSGFGESPSTELLPPDSPIHPREQFEDLAATH